jgi:adenine-specific DNA-methyltransferase
MSSIITTGVKYIGSKASLVDTILEFVNSVVPTTAPRTVLDVFTGTTRVAQAFRGAGWHVTTSDLSWASEAYAAAFVQRTATSGSKVADYIRLLRGMISGNLEGVQPGWIERTYCDVVTADGGIVKMWKPANGRKADVIRDQIATWAAGGVINRHEELVLVAALLFALDKVDSSVGVQQAYLKTWAARAANPLALEDLPIGSGPSGAHIVGDALKIEYPAATVAYLDPPYSAHSYATYYHIWDSITRWDKPAVGLKTNRRIDRVSGAEEFDDEMVSPWNSKKKALGAFMELVERLPVKYVVISYNDESLVPLEKLEAALKDVYGADAVRVKKIPYKRNIMCQIGNAAAEGGKAAEGGSGAKTENNEVLICVTKAA